MRWSWQTIRSGAPASWIKPYGAPSPTSACPPTTAWLARSSSASSTSSTSVPRLRTRSMAMKRASVSTDSMSPRATRMLPPPSASAPPPESSSSPHAAGSSARIATSAHTLFMTAPFAQSRERGQRYQICSAPTSLPYPHSQPRKRRLMSNLKSHAIYVALRERILSNDIAPGTRLVMRDVANQYEASDIPVREALRMLERDGLVETAPYRGARVTTLTAKEVEETYFIRSHLESIATGLAADRITDAELAQLDLLMIEMRAAVDAQDGPRFSALNLEFHRTIVASCGNDMLRELTMDIWRRHSGFQRVFRMVPGRLAVSQREHEGIMAALRDHDAERASRLALLHKESVRDSVSALVDQVDERGSDLVGDGARRVARDRAPAAP